MSTRTRTALKSGTYGFNYRMVPARGIIPHTQFDEARARAKAAPRELRPLYSYQHYDDAVAIYRRSACPVDENDLWESVGVILFAPVPGQPDTLEIYALEVGERFERGDVARHIPLLFGEDAARDDDERQPE